MWGTLLPKANGGGDRRDYAHSKRAIQRILCSVFTVTRWQGDTSFSTFRLARGQAGKIRPKVPACPRESKSSEITVTSVTLSPWSRCLRSKSLLLTIRKSVTCDTKVSYLRCESQLLTIRKSVTYGTKVSYLRCKSQLLTIRKSVTCDAKVSYLRCESQLLTMQKTVTYDAKDSYLRKWFKYALKGQKLLGASALSGRVGQNLQKFRCESQRLMPHNLLAYEANHKC